MTELFLSFVNRSITAGWLILAVIAFRLLFRKAPSRIRCVLWGLVGLRLVLPACLPSPLSLIPSTQTVPLDIGLAEAPAIDSGFSIINHAINPALTASFAPNPTASANPLQILLVIASMVWLIGIALIALYALVSLLRLRHRLAEAVPVGDQLWMCDAVSTPFLLGLSAPRIYLPSTLDPQTAASVIAHERAHLARHDPLWKAIGFILLALYWFHPLVWGAYVLLGRDIELACDARATRNLSPAQRKSYAEALLTCSLPHGSRSLCPLAFGEIGVKTRIRAVLQGKKPSRWLIALAVLVCIVLAVGFVTDPIPNPTPPADYSGRTLTLDEAVQLADKGNALTWSDFDGYTYTDIGSGQYIHQYIIDPTFSILVSGPSLDEAPQSITLHAGDAQVDLRSGDVAAFIDAHQTPSLEQAVSDAILAHNHAQSTADLLCTESHVTLETQYGKNPDDGSEQVTVYAMVLYLELTHDGDTIQEQGGSHIPTALTFQIHPDGSYTLTEYWEPGDGSYYAPDIRAKFPADIAEDALNTQTYIKAQEQACYNQARAYWGIDTD